MAALNYRTVLKSNCFESRLLIQAIPIYMFDAMDYSRLLSADGGREVDHSVLINILYDNLVMWLTKTPPPKFPKRNFDPASGVYGPDLIFFWTRFGFWNLN